MVSDDAARIPDQYKTRVKYTHLTVSGPLQASASGKAPDITGTGWFSSEYYIRLFIYYRLI
jgi:hypothetical protein